MSSEFLKEMQDVKSQMDQFRLFLQIQQERSEESQSGNTSKNQSQIGKFATPLQKSQGVGRSRTTPRKPFQTKNPYSPIDMPTTSNTPVAKKKLDSSILLSVSESSSDDEIDFLLKGHRKASGTPSPFKKYHFSSDSKSGLSKYSTPSEKSEKSIEKGTGVTSSDSTEISKDDISFSDSKSASDSDSEMQSYRVGSSRSDASQKNESSADRYLHKLKILRSMKLVDEVMSESDNKMKKKPKIKLRISKSFVVPYSGSYEEGEVFKIDNDDPSKDDVFSHSSDSDVAEFNNFVPPVADDFDVIQNSQKDSNEKNYTVENPSNSENAKQDKLSPIEEEVVIRIKDIPDVDVPKVDLNFLNDDENEEKSGSNGSDDESLKDLFSEVKTICTILDKEEEEESNS